MPRSRRKKLESKSSVVVTAGAATTVTSTDYPDGSSGVVFTTNRIDRRDPKHARLRELIDCERYLEARIQSLRSPGAYITASYLREFEGRIDKARTKTYAERLRLGL